LKHIEDYADIEIEFLNQMALKQKWTEYVNTKRDCKLIMFWMASSVLSMKNIEYNATVFKFSEWSNIWKSTENWPFVGDSIQIR
jgi:hypothetical protein